MVNSFNHFLSSNEFNLKTTKSLYSDSSDTFLTIYKNKVGDYACFMLSKVIDNELIGIGFYDGCLIYGGHCSLRNMLFSNKEFKDLIKSDAELLLMLKELKSKRDFYDYKRLESCVFDRIQRLKKENVIGFASINNWYEEVKPLFFPEQLTVINELSNLLF